MRIALTILCICLSSCSGLRWSNTSTEKSQKGLYEMFQQQAQRDCMAKTPAVDCHQNTNNLSYEEYIQNKSMLRGGYQ